MPSPSVVVLLPQSLFATTQYVYVTPGIAVKSANCDAGGMTIAPASGCASAQTAESPSAL